MISLDDSMRKRIYKIVHKIFWKFLEQYQFSKLVKAKITEDTLKENTGIRMSAGSHSSFKISMWNS